MFTTPLTRLTHKNIPFQWSDVCVVIILMLKTLLNLVSFLTLYVKGHEL